MRKKPWSRFIINTFTGTGKTSFFFFLFGHREKLDQEKCTNIHLTHYVGHG